MLAFAGYLNAVHGVNRENGSISAMRSLRQGNNADSDYKSNSLYVFTVMHWFRFPLTDTMQRRRPT